MSIQKKPRIDTKLDPCMFLKAPHEDLVLQIQDFLSSSLERIRTLQLPLDKVEIEAKLGRIVDKHTRQRVHVPTTSESILRPDGCHFESDMTRSQHSHYNRILNSLVKPDSKTLYKHTKTLDTFYNIGDTKVRVTRNEQDNQVLACIVKRKISDLLIVCPTSPMDYRISVSVELESKLPDKDLIPSLVRRKDRVCYSHQVYQVDLTQVKSIVNDMEQESLHELEIELRDVSGFIREYQDHSKKQDNHYTEYIQILVNTARYLIRKSPTIPQLTSK